MIRDMARGTLRPFSRAARGVARRLTGFGELRAQLDRQDAALRRVEEMLKALCAPREDPVGAAVREVLRLTAALGGKLDLAVQEQAALRANLNAVQKGLEAAVAETLAEEVNRLDGYVVFHADELRAAIAALGRDGESSQVVGRQANHG